MKAGTIWRLLSKALQAGSRSCGGSFSRESALHQKKYFAELLQKQKKEMPSQQKLVPPAHYSYLKATMGSTFVARRAGM